MGRMARLGVSLFSINKQSPTFGQNSKQLDFMNKKHTGSILPFGQNTNSNTLRKYKQTGLDLLPLRHHLKLGAKAGCASETSALGTLLGDASIPLDRGKSRVDEVDCTLHKREQGQTISSIYMTFLKTLWAHLHKYGIFVAVVPVIGNRYGFELAASRPRVQTL